MSNQCIIQLFKVWEGSVRNWCLFERVFYFRFESKYLFRHVVLIIYAFYTTYLSKSKFDSIRLNIPLFIAISCTTVSSYSKSLNMEHTLHCMKSNLYPMSVA